MDDPMAAGDATKIMQERLIGAEKDTKELAQMLVDLGISPPKEKHESELPTPDNNDGVMTIERLLSDANALISNNKEPQKIVSFGPTVEVPLRNKENKPPVQSILKKSTVTPLKLPMSEKEKSNGNAIAAQYQQLVGRLCKTESVIQSLKLSLCSLQTNKEVLEREKNSVIQRLKEEINERESEISLNKEKLREANRNATDADRRWQEAEHEVKNLHQQVQDLSEKQQGKILMSDNEMKVFREKSAKRVAEAKEELLKERSLRKSLEESHALLLTRVNDVEENVEHERQQVANLRDECLKLRKENESFKDKGDEWTKRAKEMDVVLKNLKEELDAKERAIKVLVNEQNARDQESDKISNHQYNLNKQLKECNVVLDAQKAAFIKLETQNKNLQVEIEDKKTKINLLEEQIKRKDFEHGNDLRAKEVENQNKLESMEKYMKKDVKLEKTNAEKLEDRIRILEDCVQQQEKIIQERESDIEQNTEDFDKRLDEERQKLRTATKERDEALRSKESASKELSKGNLGLKQDKDVLEQRLCELQLEYDALVEAKRMVEEENGRLMERSSAVQQQESSYKRMQDALTSNNEAKSRLAYEKGKLQTRVEQLEEELQSLASVQSQLLQVKSTNHTLEQRYQRAASELAAAKIERQRMEAEVKQMTVAMKRKESDFTLAIEARDQAMREKESVENQMETVKENESSKVHLLKRSLAECKSDNAKMAGTLENIMIRHNDLQETLDSLQTQLGRKDTEVDALQRERQAHIQQIQAMHVEMEKLRAQLQETNTNEQARITPVLAALEKARQDNDQLATSLDDVLKANSQMKEELQRLQNEVDTNQREINSMKRREDALSIEAENMSQTYAERMQHTKDQFERERDVLRKQLQSQIHEVKKALEASQSRCSQLAKGNSELRGRFAEKERVLEKLKERAKSQKSNLDRLQKEKQLNLHTNEKIKEINSELRELDKVKSLYMEKNRQQAATINTFNAEVSSLKTDILALGSAQQHVKDLNGRLEKQLEKERNERVTLMSRTKELQSQLDKTRKEKQEADEKLQKVQLETIHVQENLNEAQTWFTHKFETLQAELNRSKGMKRGAESESKGRHNDDKENHR
uniref:coiled-coil domain-containing protein 150-like n=1 Tax=Styela clava TaxID=7725 RepID=UPI001939F77A|nr:coiled-coil domain-containing protein 150-like [Styela clava]